MDNKLTEELNVCGRGNQLKALENLLRVSSITKPF